MRQELAAQVPASVLTLLRIPGVGPKKAALLYKELNVATLDQLREACLAHRVQELKGFGKKTEETILKGLDVAATIQVRMYWAEADLFVQQITAHLQELRGHRADVVGRQLPPRPRNGGRPRPAGRLRSTSMK